MNYLDLTNKQDKEFERWFNINGFWAFDNQQLEEGKNKLKITSNSELLSIGAGGIIKKSSRNELINLDKKHSKELKEHLKDDDKFKEALMYELGNHEYIITYNFDDSLQALGIRFEAETKQRQALIIKICKEFIKETEELNKQ